MGAKKSSETDKLTQEKNIFFLTILLVSVFILTATLFLVWLRSKSGDRDTIETESLELIQTPFPDAEKIETLPDTFPEDFPVYPGAILTNVWTTDKNGLSGLSATWETEDAAKYVFEYFKNNLLGGSWEVEVVSEDDSFYTLSFEDEVLAGFAGITTSDSTKTLISVTMGNK